MEAAAAEPMLTLSTSVALLALAVTIFLAVIGWLTAKAAKLEKEIKELKEKKASIDEVKDVKNDLKELITMFNSGINNIDSKVDTLIMSLLNKNGS